MDVYQKYIKKSYDINNIIKKASNAKELIEEMNKNQSIDIETDFIDIYFTIKMLNNKLMSEFMQQIIQGGKEDIIIENIEKSDKNAVLEAAKITNNSKLRDYISRNLSELVIQGDVKFENYKTFLLDENGKKHLRTIIRETVFDYKNRVNLMNLIIGNKELGNVQDYLEDFLYIKDKNQLNSVVFVLESLEKIESIDRIKLLQAINHNLDNIFKYIKNRDDQLSIILLQNILNTTIKIKNKIPQGLADNKIKDLNNIISNNFADLLRTKKYDIKLIELFREFNIENSKFKEIQDDILENLSGSDLVKYIQMAKSREGFDKDWNSIEFTKQIFKNRKDVLQDDTLIYMVSKSLEELAEHENVELKDIQLAGQGFYNFAIRIGDFVLKLGDHRRKTYIPNDKRIIKPLIRQQTNKQARNNIPNLFIEIQNAVDTNWYKDLSEDEIKEELYIIYKEIRERGKIWTDVKPENVGRLLKPNKENYELEGEELKSNNYAVSFIGKEPQEVLGTGELVIIDTDYIYKTTDDEIMRGNAGYQKEFEERYKEEKRREILEKKGLEK